MMSYITFLGPCASSPCQFGTCADRGLNYFCTCEIGYTGKNCERRLAGNCQRNPCQNGGICSVVSRNIHCTCVNGYSGRRCERLLPVVPVSPCDSSPCQNGATCSKLDASSYSCRCAFGYRGINCEDRVPTVRFPCDSAPCRNGATCSPLLGSSGPAYRCRCAPGYIGVTCDTAVPRLTACDSRPCQNGANCISLSNGGFRCSCRAAFEGRLCQFATTTVRTTTSDSGFRPGGVLGGRADIAFIVDSTGSVSRDHFERRLLPMVAKTVEKISIGPNDNQVGVITFSNKARLNIKLNQYQDSNSLASAIRRINYVPGSTNTSGALWLMRDRLFSRANGSRDGYPKIGILIVDGEATIDPQHVAREASRVLANGITMVTIGVGPWLSRTELSRIASDPDSENQLYVKNFRELDVDATYNFILGRVASVNGGVVIRTTTTQKPTTPSGTRSTTTQSTPRPGRDSCRNNPCRNGGICNNLGFSYICSCSIDYTGVNCQDRVRPSDGDVFWKCSFEEVNKTVVDGRDSWCGMTQDQSDQMDWLPSLPGGKTPSGPTGPNGPIQGVYIYMEASGRSAGDEARLFLPRTSRRGTHCLSFAYNMYGFHVKQLLIETRTSNGNRRNIDWSCDGNQKRPWKRANVQLSLKANERIAITAVRGTAFSGDIALDELVLKSGECNNANRICSLNITDGV